MVFQHPSAAALIRELWRNGELRQLCGFDPLGGMTSAPSDDAMERFLLLLVGHREILTSIFHALVEELAEAIPDLGRRLAVDSKAIPSAGRPVRNEEKQTERDGRRDLDADCPSRHSLRSFLRMYRSKTSSCRVIPRRPQAVTRGISSSIVSTRCRSLSR